MAQLDVELGLVADAAGTVDAITAVYNPAVTLSDGLKLWLISSGPNGITGVTFQPNAEPVKTMFARGGQVLRVGDTGPAGYSMSIMYHAAGGGRWELLNPATVSKNDVGLQNVDNTSDAQKVASGPIKDALDLKLNAVDYVQHFLGLFIDLAALQTAYPTADVGDYAQVDPGSGTNLQTYSWDEDDGWVLSSADGSGANNTDQLPEGGINLYFTALRAQTAAPAETEASIAAIASGAATDITFNDADLFIRIEGGVLVKFTWADIKSSLDTVSGKFMEFGDGSDGNVTISGNTTITRAMYYDTLTVNTGIVLTANGFPIYCKTALINNGTISVVAGNGTVGLPGTVGAGGAGGSIVANVSNHFAGAQGGGGGTGGSTGPGTGSAGALSGSAQCLVNVNRPSGGNGGAGTNAGGAGGVATTPAYYPIKWLTHHFMRGIGLVSASSAGHGGGGGGGSVTGGGGGGGASGNTPAPVFISAKSIDNTNGIIRSKGGNGGNGGAGFGNGGGGGGGAAGNGGLVYLMYYTMVALGTIDVTGGTAGTGGAGAGTGVAGSNGGAGNTGNYMLVNIKDGTITTV